jgi:hypothetical protein
VKELEEKGELDDADPLGAFFKKIFAGVRRLGNMHFGKQQGKFTPSLSRS